MEMQQTFCCPSFCSLSEPPPTHRLSVFLLCSYFCHPTASLTLSIVISECLFCCSEAWHWLTAAPIYKKNAELVVISNLQIRLFPSYFPVTCTYLPTRMSRGSASPGCSQCIFRAEHREVCWGTYSSRIQSGLLWTRAHFNTLHRLHRQDTTLQVSTTPVRINKVVLLKKVW